MKKLTSEILQFILIIIAIPFFIIDYLYENRRVTKIINKINDWIFELNWWGNK